MAGDLLDMAWGIMQGQLATLKRDIKDVSRLSERAETSGGCASSLLADAPLGVDGSGGGDQLWITDGRKAGEGAGAGTGVLAVYNPATDQWIRVSDDTAVVV